MYVDSIRKIFKEVYINEPMKNHTSFKTGGEADVYIKADSAENIIKAVNVLKEENVGYIIIGNGSNLLVSDKGIAGAVIEIGSLMNNITVNGTKIYAQAGALLSSLSAAAADNSLTGLEFASGIPGSVGGAVFMNAGAYGGELCQVVRSVRAWFPGEGIVTLMGGECRFGYRHSVFSEKPGVVLFVEMELTAGDSAAIKAKMEELAARRRSSQPLELPSAGSTFKRPEGYYAGTLIDQCGLKGERVGGAQVSEKHAGFIVNTGGATCADVLGLIARIQETVRERTGVALEPEVRILRG